MLPVSLSALRWAHAAVVLAGGAARGVNCGSCALICFVEGWCRGDTVRRLSLVHRWMCVKAFSILTCSDIVLHLSSELYIVPINIYSCQSSVVRRRHLHGIME